MATTQELLDHLAGQLLKDRPTTVTGGVNDPLWSDTTLVLYLNKAEQLFARRTHCIIDRSSAAASVVTQAGVASYALNKAVLQVTTARLSTALSDLPRVTHSEMYPGADNSAYPWPVTTSPASAAPRMFSTDEASRTITFSPIPDAAYTVLLRIARLPLVPMSLDQLTKTPEIPEEYHLDLCDWAAYLALSEPEIGGDAPDQAARFRAKFMDAMRLARLDIIRSESGPMRFFFGGW